MKFKSKVHWQIGLTLAFLCSPMKAYALPPCVDRVDEVRSVEYLSAPLDVTVEYHDLYCRWFGEFSGDDNLDEAKLMGRNTSYIDIYSGDGQEKLGTYGYQKGVSQYQRFDHASIPQTPKDFPYLAILYSRQGASASSHEYRLYSTDQGLHQIAVISGPKGKGSWWEIEGFYEKDGDYYINTMTTKGTFTGGSRASQDWNVETFVLDGENLESVYLGQGDDQDFSFMQWMYTVGYRVFN